MEIDDGALPPNFHFALILNVCLHTSLLYNKPLYISNNNTFTDKYSRKLMSSTILHYITNIN